MMRTANIDFARDRASNRRYKKALLAILGMVFGLQIGLAAWRFQALEARRATLDVQYRQLTGKSSQTGAAALSPDQLKTVAGAQAMLDSLAVPWEGLLSAIEAARTQHILVDAIQPHAQDGSVSISASSSDFAGVADFIGRLEQQPLLHDVMLVSEALPESGSGSLRVVISANWRTTK